MSSSSDRPSIVQESARELKAPVFVVGSPRSGTTLLQCLLSACDEAFSVPETHFFVPLEGRREDWIRPLSAPTLRHALDYVEEKTGFRFPDEELQTLLARADAGCLLPKEVFVRLVRRQCPDAGDRRLIEKTPFHVFRMAGIVEMFPDARFVNLVRDPRDVVSSRRSLPDAPWRSLYPFCQDWLAYVVEAERFALADRERILTLRYEDLAAEPEAVLEAVCSFLELRFTPEALREFGGEAGRNTLGELEPWKSEVRSGSVRNKHGVWRERLTPGEGWVIEWLLQRPMLRYGYVPSCSALADGQKVAALDQEKALLEHDQHTGRQEVASDPAGR